MAGSVESLTLLRFIPAIPLLGAALNIFFGARLGRKNAGLLACLAVALSFLLSLWASALPPSGGILKGFDMEDFCQTCEDEEIVILKIATPITKTKGKETKVLDKSESLRRIRHWHALCLTTR